MIDFNKIPVRISYVREVASPFNDGQAYDEWSVFLGTTKVEHFNYFTGLGLRKRSVPVTPTVEEVLYNLVMDAEVELYSFKEWCNEFEYSVDSIKAYKVYKACLKNAKKLRSALSEDVFEQIKEALQGY